MSESRLTSLHSLRVAFTGRLAALSRAEAERLVRAAGGEPVLHVSRRVSVLVVGMGGWPLAPDGGVSEKLRQAQRNNQGGQHTRIISELEFLELLGRRQPPAEIQKTYAAGEIARLVGVSPGELQHWELLGLVRAQGGKFDFQDMVSLRTIVELVQRGVRADVISRSLYELSSFLPNVDRPLAQLRIVAQSARSLVAELGERLLAPDGQFLMNFEAAEAASGDAEAGGAGIGGAAPTAAVRISESPGAASGWIECGRRFEEAERFEDALGAYEQALRAGAPRAAAHFNLGNVLRELGRGDEARAAFERTVEADPQLAEGWYNLADLQEEAGDVHAAIASLQSALRAAPDFADAHFNLALCLERNGHPREARTHWRRYLLLDQGSEWSQLARARLTRQVEGGEVSHFPSEPRA
ncbi:DNA polymerase III subunit epsilon [Phycisphaerae bacterium RAS1]|nr:DNA polymerase III subunit epsilon [Phycisphaerae bacterium RAS1]